MVYRAGGRAATASVDDGYGVGVVLGDDPWKAQLEALGALLRAQRTTEAIWRFFARTRDVTR